MKQIDKDRWLSLALCYDAMAGFLVPKYHFLQDELIELLPVGRPLKYVVDLGGGSGIFLEKLLDRRPQATAVWVDRSEGFLAVARERLARFGTRVSFVLCPLEDDWSAHLTAAPEAICSMSAIHHLNSAGKQALYRRCFDVLAPGGWFYNVDEMSTLYADAYRRTLDYWVAHVERAAAQVPPPLHEMRDQWCRGFEGWKRRNVQNVDLPKQPGDDIHECYLDQLHWLHEIGFVNVDLFIKFQLWSVIGGQKPS
jgi:tRNA (cmo5U34)-methyltransferase